MNLSFHLPAARCLLSELAGRLNAAPPASLLTVATGLVTLCAGLGNVAAEILA